jgi:hypothetical protein
MSKTKKYPYDLDVNVITCSLNSAGDLESFLTVMSGLSSAGFGLFLLPDQDAADSMNFSMAVLGLPDGLGTPSVRQDFLQQVQHAVLSFRAANGHADEIGDGSGAAGPNSPKHGGASE